MPQDITTAYAASLLPERPEDGHKGTFGHALIIAGSRGFTGAAKLAAEGACRSGTGLVTVATPATQQAVVASGLLEAMTIGLPATPDDSISPDALPAAMDASVSRDAVGIGPGISKNPATVEFVRAFVAACPKPLVIDADGLNALAGQTKVLRATKMPAIVTPHPGEMLRLSDRPTSGVHEDRIATATSFSHSHNCVVVLKGHRTVVAAPNGDTLINTTGNAGLATGGTGDVLTGLIAGLLAQGCSAPDVAALGVFVHGLAGDIAADAMTQRGMIARDVCGCIPEAWAVLEAEAAK